VVLGALSWITYTGRSRLETQQSPVPAKVTQAVIQITSDPAGATVWLGGESTERQTPMTLDGRVPGQVLQLKLVLAGYKGWEEQIQVKGGEQIVAAELVTEESSPGAAAGKAAKTMAPGEFKTTKPARKPKRAKASKKKTVKVAREPGRLFLRSSGLWFHVYLDGKQIGTTPLAGTVVPAGKHTLTLKNDVAGEQRQISVEVAPGAVIRRTISQ